MFTLVIPGYTLTELICETSDLALYRATRTLDGLPVLLKVPVAERLEPDLLRRLEHEFELARDLDPDRVVRPIVLARDAATAALVLEQGPDRALASMLGSPMAIRAFLQIAIGITAALAELHHHELVHKDIKPEHILLDADSHVWLTGLGIASRLPREHQVPEPPEVIDGTLAYMAPEQTGRMNRSIDSRSDLYSLGITFYQMLTGVLPFSANDPMEWVHCHIARQSLPPVQHASGIPELVSEMIMKLLAKTAEERYQSAGGLETDLRRCLVQWESHGGINRFPLGADDVLQRLLIPEKLYGRKSEIDTLLAAFDRVASSGTSEVVLVSGYSGIGKTSVINELHRVLVPFRGLFAAGKYDQYKRDIPYATLIQAIQTLVRQILARSEAEVVVWRERLQQAVGPNGQLIVGLIPEVELLIGQQPPVADLPPQEAHNRFQMVLRQFLRGFAGSDHPLVIFLDDLQWLDAATLDLLNQVAMGLEGNYILLIGAYRDNEVVPTHPLMHILDTMRKVGTCIQEIVLAPLEIADVAELISDALRCEQERVLPLAQLVHERTGGNPFFTIQFLSMLYQEGLLTHSENGARWEWDLDTIQLQGFTDNVAELMVSKLEHFSAATRKMLMHAACIGDTAAVRMLALLCDCPADQVHAVLGSTVNEGLMWRLDGGYKFLHDRVREAAYALIPAEERPVQHLRIGRLLLEHTQEAQLNTHIFEIVGHLNLGISLIDTSVERERLAELNLVAGKRARVSTAYASAIKFYATGTSLLGPTAWEEKYKLASALLLEQAECEYLTGNFAYSDELLTRAINRVVTKADRIWAYRMHVRLYQLSGRFKEAMAVALDALRLYGISFPESDADIQTAIEAEIRQVAVNLRGRSIAELADIPLSEDAEFRAMIGLLEESMPLIFTARPLLWVLINTRGTNLCLQHGNADESPFIYSGYAMILVGVVRDIPSAIQFSEMSIKLNERLPRAAAWRGKLLFHHGAVINVWGSHLATNLPLLDEAFQASLDAGDLANAGYLTYNAIWLHFENGNPLDEVVELARRYTAFTRQNHNDIVCNVDRIEEQFVLALQGKTQSLTDFNDASFDEEESLAAIRQSGFGLGVAYHHIMKLVAAYLAGEYEEAREWADRAAPMLLQVASMVNEVTYHFYHALTLAALFPQATLEQQREYQQTFADVLEKLTYWAEYGPENFANRLALIQAEVARIEGRNMEAMRLYEQAIQSARDNGFVQQEGLSNELAADFYQEQGFERIATTSLREAHACYARWGAQAKLRQMEQRYPQLREAAALASGAFSTGSRDIDILAVTQASQAISGELHLNNLLKTLIRIVLENAGARQGYLLLNRGKGLMLAAEARVDDQTLVMHVSGEPDLTEVELPASILNFVRRSQSHVLLDDASVANLYSADDYFKQRRPKSVLCLPITKQTRLIGVLYLENDLVTHVFTPDRLAIVELLAAQAAISLEHVQTYEALREGRSKYRALVESTNDWIWELDVQGIYTYSSPQVHEMLGYTTDEVIGKTPFDLMTPGDRERLKSEFTSIMAGRKSFRLVENANLHKDGHVVFLETSGVPMVDAEGVFKGYRGIDRDITERKDAERERAESAERLEQILMQTIAAIAATVEARDPYTAGHEQRVAQLASAIGREMGLADDVIHGIYLAASIHDLGKIRVPSEILSKPGRLSEIEYELIKTHSQTGYDIVKDIQFPAPVAQMVLQHHERLDGSGYPQGLKGEQILLEARILVVSDVVEAMSSHRPYRAGLGIDAALAEITHFRGVYYDEQVVDSCLTLFRENRFSFEY